MPQPARPVHAVAPRYPILRTLGFAVEHFPAYTNTQVNLHAVDVVLMSIIIRGRGRHYMDDARFEERAGSIGVTHYGQVHSITTTPRGMDIYNVYLDLRRHPLPALPAEFEDVITAILPLRPAFRNTLNRSVHFQVPQPRRLAELLARLETELRQRRPGWEDVARACFQIFLIECCRCAREGGISLSPSARTPAPPWLQRICQTLDRNYARPMNLRDLATGACVSIGHLCRSFKAYTGRTVFAYLIERRIQAAMIRLRHGDEKVLGVALACGFNDLAYFNRTFKRLVGQTPRSYRRAGQGQAP